jgi:hypothetical protein
LSTYPCQTISYALTEVGADSPSHDPFRNEWLLAVHQWAGYRHPWPELILRGAVLVTVELKVLMGLRWWTTGGSGVRPGLTFPDAALEDQGSGKEETGNTCHLAHDSSTADFAISRRPHFGPPYYDARTL